MTPNMFKRIGWVALSCLLFMGLWSCKTTQTATQGDAQSSVVQEDNSPVLLSFQEGVVRKAEFERVYAKNNGGPEEAAQQPVADWREYLDLYVNFKRKVFEAEAMGLDTTPAFKQEFNTYRKQLVQPYLSAKEVEEQLIQQAYDRSGYLVSASHLLVKVQPEASPEDSLQAYQRIMAYRDSIMNGGKDFAEMARKYSQDPSAAQNAGSLGYFSAFDMVYPFENAAFNTPVGEVSPPIRTQFGYHILKVHDKIKSEGTKHAAHIIVRVGDRYTAKTDAQAKEIIDEIHQKLKAGEEFGKLAQQYSDDPNSAPNGGDLGTGRLLPEMENLKNQLGEGEFSEPFQTRFGWHILTVSQIEKRPPFDEARYTLKQKIQRDSRSQIGRDALIQKIKKENGYQFEQASFDAFAATLDNKFPSGVWQADTSAAAKAIYAQSLFSLANGSYNRSIQDFIDYYTRKRPRRTTLPPAMAAASVAEEYVEQELLAYEEEQLPNKNPEFRYLLQEYRDGILLFTLMEQKVWKKAVEDTTGLKNYYEAHRDSFYKEEIIEVKSYSATDRSVLTQLEKWWREGWTEAQIDSAVNQTSALNLRTIRQSFEKGQEGSEEVWFDLEVGDRTAIFAEGETFRILEIEEKRPAGIQALDKVKSEAITRYQDHLEKEWLAELATKYPVEINEDVFSNLFK
jgi:peptidyl-prolyl cis-trans isomerase SurA